jgi:hypothetical protein
MGSRVQLQALLEELIGSENVYFQPPESEELIYPCIIFNRSLGKTTFANDKPYNHSIGYSIKVIDANPDSEIPGKIAMLPMCTFDRHYTVNNLNHDVYNLYY